MNNKFLTVLFFYIYLILYNIDEDDNGDDITALCLIFFTIKNICIKKSYLIN